EEYFLPAAHSRLGANSADYRAMGPGQSQKRGRVRRMGRAASSFSGISLSIASSKRWKRAKGIEPTKPTPRGGMRGPTRQADIARRKPQNIHPRPRVT